MSVDPLLDRTDQAYVYARDDPIGATDPAGACSSRLGGGQLPRIDNSLVRFVTVLSAAENRMSSPSSSLAAERGYVSIHRLTASGDDAGHGGCPHGGEIVPNGTIIIIGEGVDGGPALAQECVDGDWKTIELPSGGPHEPGGRRGPHRLTPWVSVWVRATLASRVGL